MIAIIGKDYLEQITNNVLTNKLLLSESSKVKQYNFEINNNNYDQLKQLFDNEDVTTIIVDSTIVSELNVFEELIDFNKRFIFVNSNFDSKQLYVNNIVNVVDADNEKFDSLMFDATLKRITKNDVIKKLSELTKEKTIIIFNKSIYDSKHFNKLIEKNQLTILDDYETKLQLFKAINKYNDNVVCILGNEQVANTFNRMKLNFKYYIESTSESMLDFAIVLNKKSKLNKVLNNLKDL